MKKSALLAGAVSKSLLHGMLLVLCCGFWLAACGPPPDGGQDDLPVLTLTMPPSGVFETFFLSPQDQETIDLGSYQVQFQAVSSSGFTDFQLSIMPEGQSGSAMNISPSGNGSYPGGHTWWGEYLWTPSAPGTYVLNLRASDQNGFYGSQEEITVFVVELMAAEPGIPAVVEIGPPQDCFYLARANLFCRLGPAMFYPRVGDLFPGDSVPVAGRTLDGEHVYVDLGEGRICAAPLRSEYGELSPECSEDDGDGLENLPVLPLPPTPTPQPTPTATLTPTNEPGSGGAGAPQPQCTDVPGRPPTCP